MEVSALGVLQIFFMFFFLSPFDALNKKKQIRRTDFFSQCKDLCISRKVAPRGCESSVYVTCDLKLEASFLHGQVCRHGQL